MEGWARLGIQAADTVITIRQSLAGLLRDIPNAERDYHDVISRSIEEIPDPTLPSALRTALTDLDPTQLVTHLRRLLEAGIPWMSERGIRRVALLAAPRPQFGTVRPLDPASLEGDIYWRLYLAVLGHPAQVNPEEVIPIISRLPMPIVDDLIDMGVMGQDDKPWDYRKDRHEAIYLRARLAPLSISHTDAEHLGWQESMARHAFLNGEAVTGDEVLEKLSDLYAGITDGLFDLRAALPPAQRTLLNEILEGARGGWWPEHITADRGLWRLLVEQWAASVRDDDEQRGSMASRGSELINATHSEFHAWYAFCAAYDLILAGRIDRAEKQAESLAKANDVSPSLRAEISNLLAYLAQRPDVRKHENLEKSIKLLSDIVKTSPAAEANLALIRERSVTSTNNREFWENPYFMLGVPHGDLNWNERWRELSLNYRDDIDTLSILNDAWKRISSAEKFGTPFFVLPLDPSIFNFPKERSLALLPPLQPLLRQTTTGQEDLQFIKSLSAPDLLIDFIDSQTLRTVENEKRSISP